MSKLSKRGASGALRFQSNDDENDDYQYQPSDSDDGYTEAEKKLLDRTRHRDTGDKDSEEEVFGIQSSDDDEEEEEDVDETNMDSDIEGNEEDNLPNVRAWGKSKKIFHSTDYVDEDYGGFQGKDAQEADYEEQEARAIQHRLAQQLDDADFSLEFLSESPAQEADTRDKSGVQEKEQVKTDLSSLSKRQKLALLQKEAPEFTSIVQDFKARMQELDDKLEPILSLIKECKIPRSPATDFVKTRYHLTLNYCTNILFYLLMKARRMPVQSHPIVRRLVQYRQLLQQLEPLWTNTVQPQCDELLAMVEEGEDIQPLTPKAPSKATKKLLKLLKSTSSAVDEGGGEFNDEVSTEPKSKKLDRKAAKTALKPKDAQTSKTKGVSFADVMEEDDEDDEDNVEDAVEVDDNDQAMEETEGETQEAEKRGITYQIAKNKGLTPHRKKEQRNPRVKNRNKYRKALIRRKGQVRSVRTEMERYGGEIFGIKARVKKGIKIKV